MANKTFTKDEIYDIVDGWGVGVPTNDGDAVHVSSKPAKHGCIRETYVVKQDGSYWKFSFERHDDEGWQIDGDIIATEVIPQEKAIVEWVQK